MNDKIDIELAEDEDLARAKAWWKENGSSIVGGVVIGTMLVLGYNFWQSYQEDHAREVAQLYEEYSQAPQQEAALSTLLQTEDKTTYAQLARMSAARSALDDGKLDEAEGLLNAVLESGADDGMRYVAALRLAAVYLANQKPDAARELLESYSGTGLSLMQARIDELLGDLSRDKGDLDNAKEYYESSLIQLEESGQSAALVQLKLDNL